MDSREKTTLALGILFLALLLVLLVVMSFWTWLTFEECRATNSLRYCLRVVGWA